MRGSGRAFRPHPGALHGIAAGARASDLALLAHFAMEPRAGRSQTVLRLTLRPGGQTQELGAAGFHGEWIDRTGAG